MCLPRTGSTPKRGVDSVLSHYLFELKSKNQKGDERMADEKLSDILKEVKISTLKPPCLIRINAYGIANITIDDIRDRVVVLESEVETWKKSQSDTYEYAKELRDRAEKAETKVEWLTKKLAVPLKERIRK